MEYKELLKKAFKELPEDIQKEDRFTIPNIKGHIQGNKTVLSNFFQIADLLERDRDDFMKFILKELATPGEIDKNRLVLGRKVSASSINDKIEEYAKKYVVCKQCGKYDTKLIRQDRVQLLKCQVCGARYPV